MIGLLGKEKRENSVIVFLSEIYFKYQVVRFKMCIWKIFGLCKALVIFLELLSFLNFLMNVF